jgi:hypothetical protein
MVGAKLNNVGVPAAAQDGDYPESQAWRRANRAGYCDCLAAGVRTAAAVDTLFTELRELVCKTTEGAARRISLSVPALRALSLRFIWAANRRRGHATSGAAHCIH